MQPGHILAESNDKTVRILWLLWLGEKPLKTVFLFGCHMLRYWSSYFWSMERLTWSRIFSKMYDVQILGEIIISIQAGYSQTVTQRRTFAVNSATDCSVTYSGFFS